MGISNFIKKWHTLDVLHDKVDVLYVVVGLEVFHYVGVVKFIEGRNLLNYQI